MKYTFFLTAVAALLSSAASAASAAPPQLRVMTQAAVPAEPQVQATNAAVLYDQTSDDSFLGTISQNFEADYDAYDNQAADDFTVPAGKTWKITEVHANGAYFSGFGPAASVHITFYKQKRNKNKPGAVVADFPALACKDYFGSFSCKLPTGVKLKAGTYWLSVQANLDYTAGGEWVWENRTVTEGSAAMWQNPRDAFGTGCVTYRAEHRCIAEREGDHMFKLLGRSF